MTTTERNQLKWRIDQEKARGRYWARVASEACEKSSQCFQHASELVKELAEADRPKLRVIDGKD